MESFNFKQKSLAIIWYTISGLRKWKLFENNKTKMKINIKDPFTLYREYIMIRVVSMQFQAACHATYNSFSFKQNSGIIIYTKCIQNTKYLTKGMDDAKKVPSGQQTINSVFFIIIVDDGRSGIVIKSEKGLFFEV